jgi:hypothetical protein
MRERKTAQEGEHVSGVECRGSGVRCRALSAGLHLDAGTKLERGLYFSPRSGFYITGGLNRGRVAANIRALRNEDQDCTVWTRANWY